MSAPRGLRGLVAAQAQARPEARAVVAGGTALSYGALDAAANRLAHAIDATGARPGDRVALVLQKSPEAIVAMLACLARGLPYVPIDTGSPAARAQKIVDACRPALVLAHRPAAALAGALRAPAGGAPLPVGWLGDGGPAGEDAAAPAFTGADLAALPDTALDPPGGDRLQPAHILFTSGSTGTPKGVVVGQPGILAFLEWATAHFGLRPGDRHSGHSPLHFDLSTFDVFGTLAVGAELHLVPAEINLLAPRLAQWIRDAQLTQWFSVPSILTYLVKFDAVRQDDFPSLRRLLWCGEVLPTPALRTLMRRLPHARFTNLYGPTEATIASSWYDVAAAPPDDRAEIPIGVACGGEALHVLDDAGAPCAPGVPGDLFISGVGLAEGYWEDPEKTASAFTRRPDLAGGDGRVYRTGDRARRGEDGLVYFLGRTDAQIKSRGYRIELGEIEAALATLEPLREGVIVALPTGGFEGYAIACAFVPQPGAAVSPPLLRERLARLLPPYMLPTRWRQLEALPRTSNGKADRRAVLQIFEGAPEP